MVKDCSDSFYSYNSVSLVLFIFSTIIVFINLCLVFMLNLL